MCPVKMSNIWISIVNYRTPELTIECLRALSSQVVALANISVVVVDNNSGDGSDTKLAVAIESESWSSWVKLVPMEKNGGFAFGNNVCIRLAQASPVPVDYIMLLNPDTVVHTEAVKVLIDFMDAHPDVGIAGSQLKNADGSVECSAHTFPSPLSELDGAARLGMISRILHRYVVTHPAQAEAHACDWVSGASMIIRRQVIEDIGLMDEGFFLYFEEVDFCHRAKLTGWECWHVPDSKVVHLEGASTGINATAKRRAGYWYDSRRRFFIKHYGITGLIGADILWATGRISYVLRRSLRLGVRNDQNIDPKWVMFDLLWGDMRAMLTGQAWGIGRTGKQV